MAQYSPVLTAGGRREAEIATPTIDPALPPSTEIATPTPLGIAIAKPTTRQLQPVLEAISGEGQVREVTASTFRVLEKIMMLLLSTISTIKNSNLLNLTTNRQPKMKPQMMQIRRLYISL